MREDIHLSGGGERAKARRRRPVAERSCALALWLGCALLMSIAPARADGNSLACKEQAARFAIGQPYSDELAQKARRAAGAKALRKIEPGRFYTMEFRADRLNLEVDGKDRVVAVRCG